MCEETKRLMAAHIAELEAQVQLGGASTREVQLQEELQQVRPVTIGLQL